MIDADAHVEESARHWQYLPPALQPWRPLAVDFPPDTAWGVFNAGWIVEGKIRQGGATPTTMANATGKAIALGSQELSDVPARLADLNRAGIERQVIYPTVWLACMAENVALETALARSYNQYMAEQCAQSGGRLTYAAVVPFRDPAAAVAELQRVRKQGSAAAIFVRGIEWDRPLSDPAFFPIYEAAERLDLAMGVHIGFGSPTINSLFEGLPRHPGENPFLTIPFIPPRGFEIACAFHAPFALASIVAAGLLDDFPRLRWVFLEAGAEVMHAAANALPRAGQRHPRRYFEEGRLYVGCEPDEDVPYLVNRFGPDWLVVGSDMPHNDSFQHVAPAARFQERGDLGDCVLEKLFRENPRRLYGL